MKGMSEPMRASRFAVLAAVGLAIGFTWHAMQVDHRKSADAAPWYGSALNAVRRVASSEPAATAVPPFALRGTVVSTEPASSMAIFDLGKGRVYSLSQGATLPGVGRVLEIGNNGVYLEVNGTRRLFAVGDSTLDPEKLSSPAQFVAQGISPIGPPAGKPEETVTRRSSAAFVVPADAPRISDAPREEPELNATPKPGQSIDTTVWD